MLPQRVILSIFAALLAQGNLASAFPVESSPYEGIAGRDAPSDLITREAEPSSNDIFELSARDTSDLSTRTVTDTVTAVAIPALCVLAHKILAGIFVYVNCPEPVQNLQTAFSNLKKAGKQAINFQPQWDLEQRQEAVVTAAPAEVRIPLRAALKDTASELLKASFIVMDTAAAAVYRAGGTHADVGGTPLHPAVSNPAPAPVPVHDPIPAAARPVSPATVPAPAHHDNSVPPRRTKSLKRLNEINFDELF